MNSQYKIILLSLALTGFGFSPAFGDSSRGCEEINWSQQILADFEDIKNACQEVVVRNGKTFVRFEAKLVRVLNDNKMEVLITLKDGDSVERVFSMPSDFQILSYSGKTTFNPKQLDRGDKLDIFIPESRIVVAQID